MNRKQLIAYSRKRGFKGVSSLEAISEFYTEGGFDGFEIEGKQYLVKDFADMWGKDVMIQIPGLTLADLVVEDDAGSGEAEGEGKAEDGEDDIEEEEEEAEAKRLAASVARKKSLRDQQAKVRGAKKVMNAESYDRISARKRYDRKAALGKTSFSSADMMEASNAFMRLSWLKNYGNGEYDGRKEDMEIFTKAGGTFDNTLGGFLVPNGVSEELIELKEQYGVARQLAGVTSMPLPKWDVNRFGDDVVVYKTSEGASMTQSDMTFGQVTLLSEEIGALSLQSNRLLRLSAVDIGDAFSRSAMRGFAKFEDGSYFNGENGFEGLSTKVGANSTKDVTGLTAWSGISLDDLLEWTSLLPAYTDQFAPSEIPITCTRPVFQQVFRKYAMAQGGSSMEDQLNAGELEFDGHPIILNNSMARTFANNAIAAYIGPFKHVTKFGELEGSMSFDSSDHRHFDSNQMAFRGLEEIAINCHNVNNVNDSDGNNTSGVVALQVGT